MRDPWLVLLLLLLLLLSMNGEKPSAHEHDLDGALLQPVGPGAVLRVLLYQGRRRRVTGGTPIRQAIGNDVHRDIAGVTHPVAGSLLSTVV